MPTSSAWRSIVGESRQRSRGDRWRIVVLQAVSIALVTGLDAALSNAGGARTEQAACGSINETDLERAVGCMSLEELATQLTAFNPYVGRRLTGRTIEELVAAGLGTVMGVTADPKRVHALQKLARENGHPPLLLFQDTERGERTILPSSLAQSFTWNLDLVEAGARMAARETAATGHNGILGPVADHSCTTRNGRAMETKGESPWLASRYVERLVRGFQGASLEARDTVAATLKHWIGYQCSEDGTDYRGADITDLELLETHAPAFEAGFRAGAALYMPAFTQLHGIPMHMNAWANTELRTRLGGGTAISIGDHAADAELIEHGVAGDVCDAALKAFQGGLHITLQGGSYLACLPELVEQGRLARADVAARVLDVLRLKKRLGLYEDRQRYGRPGDVREMLLSPEHRAIARQLAREALVLLTGPDETPLPLEHGARILVTGPLADDPSAMLGAWSARGRAEDVVTPCAGLQSAFGRDRVTCAPIRSATSIREREIEAALDAASSADAIVLMLGETGAMSGEAASRLYPGIPGSQHRLVDALKRSGKPLVAIVTAGRALPLSGLVERITERPGGAGAVFFSSQLGIGAGHAIADVLSGRHPPSGRLSVSLPCETGIISRTFRDRRGGRPRATISPLMHDFREKIGNAGRWVSHFQETFDRKDCPVAFPFGHGLTYSDITYSDFRLSAERLTAADPNARIEASVTLTNEGPHAGVAVPQLYIRDTVAMPAPRRLELRGFRRLELRPGESMRVTFEITPADLARHAVDPQTGRVELDRKPQPDPYPVAVFISRSSGVSDATPQGSFVLTP